MTYNTPMHLSEDERFALLSNATSMLARLRADKHAQPCDVKVWEGLINKLVKVKLKG